MLRSVKQNLSEHALCFAFTGFVPLSGKASPALSWPGQLQSRVCRRNGERGNVASCAQQATNHLTAIPPRVGADHQALMASGELLYSSSLVSGPGRTVL